MKATDRLVPIPPITGMNKGLSAAEQSTMLKAFGKPGKLSQKCAATVPRLRKWLVFDADIGPFKVSGLNYAVDSLRQVFDQVNNELPEVYRAIRTAGMLCVRARRSNPSRYSNHSWGTAIDLYFGKGPVAQGIHLTQEGIYLLYPYLNNHGWYWGAEFSGDYVDSMHFELAEETISKLPSFFTPRPETRKRSPNA